MYKTKSINNKGFSLVELIIVMAIMAALVAIIAPQFMGYIQRARDSVINDSAEEVLHIAKSEYAIGNLRLKDGETEGNITIKSGSDGMVEVILDDTLEYISDTTGIETFQQCCAQDGNKKAKSNIVWEIKITEDCYGTMFTREKTQGGEET